MASVTRDATPQLQSTLKLDSLFKTINNPNLRLEARIYNTDHFGVAVRSLIGAFLYYNRPIELLAYKMKKPRAALNFADDLKQKKPVYLLDFSYAIALYEKRSLYYFSGCNYSDNC